jgi:hypothetical protein
METCVVALISDTLQYPDIHHRFSKAINTRQFPFSILACQEHLASKYAIGLYGNTMVYPAEIFFLNFALLHFY